MFSRSYKPNFDLADVNLADVDMSRCNLEHVATLEKFIRLADIPFVFRKAPWYQQSYKRIQMCQAIQGWLQTNHSNEQGDEVLHHVDNNINQVNQKLNTMIDERINALQKNFNQLGSDSQNSFNALIKELQKHHKPKPNPETISRLEKYVGEILKKLNLPDNSSEKFKELQSRKNTLDEILKSMIKLRNPSTSQKAQTSSKIDKSLQNYSSSADVESNAYINKYPGQEQNISMDKNVQFYSNEIVCEPDEVFIDFIHDNWFGSYQSLEEKHGYIQWLFPIREQGMNSMQQPLQIHEALTMKEDDQIKIRVVKSYRLMLNFYGYNLVDETTGELKQNENHDERITNMIQKPHNYRRVTRILKCLGEVGFEHLKLGFCLMLWQSANSNLSISTNSMKETALDFWFKTLRDQNDRDTIDDVVRGKRSMSQYHDIVLQSSGNREEPWYEDQD